LVVEINFCTLNPRAESDLEVLYLFCKEGWVKSVLGEYHTHRQALSRFFLGAMVLTDPVVDVIRRELRRVSPDVRIESEQIRAVLAAEVLKREVMEGDKADDARRKISRSANKSLRAGGLSKAKDGTNGPELMVPAIPQSVVQATIPVPGAN
jgi:hypothetical protein